MSTPAAATHGRRPHRLSAQWRRAPLALLNHQSALLAVFAAGLLTALAAASAPFVTTAAASAALKDKLAELSPYSTGLVVVNQTVLPGDRSAAAELASYRARAAAVGRRAAALPFAGSPDETILSPSRSAALVFNTPEATAAGRAMQVRLVSRPGAPAHVRVLSRVAGPGVWIPDSTARYLRLKAGDSFGLDPGRLSGDGKSARLRVKGIYRALAAEPQAGYWSNFLEDIYPRRIDDPPPPPFVFLDRKTLFGLVAHRAGATLDEVSALPVDPHGLTLPAARSLVGDFAVVKRELRPGGGVLARRLGCHRVAAHRASCSASSSLAAAVLLADANVSAISPAVTLLSAAGTAIALAVAATAGVFLVRRRRAEAALLFARGERVTTFGLRTAVEAFLPLAIGGAAGFLLAFALTGVFAPSGSTDGATVSRALVHTAVAIGLALLLVVGAASAGFLTQFDSGLRPQRWLRWLPWELVLLAAALVLLHRVTSGGGLVASGTSATHHPTLAVFVYPLLLVAAVAGLLARGIRLLLKPRPGPGRSRLPTALFFAVRRLSAARAALVVLSVVSAVAFGAFFYAEALAASLTQNVAEKAYIARGGDAQGLISDSTPLPRSFPYPVTRVEYGNQVASVGSPDGAQADMMVVDPATITSVIHWYPSWGPDPGAHLRALAPSPTNVLPVIATDDVPPSTRAVWIQGKRFPIAVVAGVKAFPGMSAGIPLIITSFGAIEAASRHARLYSPLGEPFTYAWAKGPPAAAARALQAAPVQAYYVTSVDTFRKDPDVLLATRTYSYMRTIAIAAGFLVLVGLLLYLQARQRSQAIASALARRMGLRRSTEILSLAFELTAIALFAAVVGGVVAIAAAGPIVGHLDPLPDDPPTPSLAIPLEAIALSGLCLVLLAVAAGALTSWLARRTDVSEAIRVA